MKHTIMSIALLVSSSLGFFVYAQDMNARFYGLLEVPDPVTMTLTVDEAVETALANNLGLVQEDLTLRGRKRTRDTAWNVFVPSVSASATMTRLREEVPSMGGGAFIATDISAGGVSRPFIGQYLTDETYQGTLGAALNFQLVLTPQLWYGYKATVLDYEAGLLSAEKARADLETNIKRQFYGLVVQEEQIQILENQLNAIEKRYQQALDNYNFGFVDEYTTLSVRVNLESFKPQLEMARFGYTQAMMAFKLALGLNIDSDITLNGGIAVDPKTYDAQELIGAHIADRTDLRQLLKTIDNLKNMKRVQQTSLLPRLILGYQLGTDYSGDPWSGLGEDWNESQTSGALSVTLNLQLSEYFPFSSTMNGLKGMDDTIEKTKAGLSMAFQAARMEIIAAVEQLNNSVLTIKAKELNVDLAERAYALAEESYNAGGKSLLDVEDAEDALQNARFQLLSEKFNYITALLTLEAAINAPLAQ
ncbi:MAG: TolC family protein [Spirochaetales bacterium]|nr:TolC family protein [Spirochaetales bacterium]